MDVNRNLTALTTTPAKVECAEVEPGGGDSSITETEIAFGAPSSLSQHDRGA